jgi:hypothetical protein
MQEILGVYLRNCMVHYGAYRNYFPMWALAEYRKHAISIAVTSPARKEVGS